MFYIARKKMGVHFRIYEAQAPEPWNRQLYAAPAKVNYSLHSHFLLRRQGSNFRPLFTIPPFPAQRHAHGTENPALSSGGGEGEGD